MLAGDFFHSTFISKIELQNIFRALCLCYGAAPLLNLKEYFSASPAGTGASTSRAFVPPFFSCLP